MPDTLHPPYNIYQPRVLNRWLDVNSQNGPLKRAQTYLLIPAFNVVPTWLGYSDIVVKYCYEAPNNFSLLRVKGFAVPNGLPFALVIAWIDDSYVVHRYALNRNSNSVIYFDLPFYTNQKIGKNFSIEVWSINATALLSSAITLYTSVLQNIDYRFGEDSVLPVTTTCVPDIGYVLSPTESIVFGNPDSEVIYGNPDADIGFGQPGSQ